MFPMFPTPVFGNVGSTQGAPRDASALPTPHFRKDSLPKAHHLRTAADSARKALVYPVLRCQGSRISETRDGLRTKQILFNMWSVVEAHRATLAASFSLRSHASSASILSSMSGVAASTCRLYVADFKLSGFPSQMDSPKPHEDAAARLFRPEIQHHLPCPIFADTDSDVIERQEQNAIPAQPSLPNTVARWREHPVWPVAMRMAELSTFWIRNALPRNLFHKFVSWLHMHWRGSMGDLNHNGDYWLHTFQTSLNRVLERSTCASLHELVPALGMPSDIARVVDGISVLSGESLWAVIHVVTSASGRLSWHLLDLPNLANLPKSSRSKGLPRFALHGAARLVALTHHAESRFEINTADRLLRLVLNVGDGAIEGPFSVHMAKHEAQVMNTTYAEKKSSSCEFHLEDHAGADTDKQFPLAKLYDQFLRLVKIAFGRGKGQHIGRSVAREFQRIIDSVEADSMAVSAKAKRTANMFKVLGWHVWTPPIAPQIGGTRKIVYASGALLRFFQMIPLIYWALRVRMIEVKEQVALAALRRGHEPGASAGTRTVAMRKWCSMGRTLLNIKLLIFNMGRANFRDAFLIKYTKKTQRSLHVDVGRFQDAVQTGEAMLEGIRQLLYLTGLVRFLKTLFDMYHLGWHRHCFPSDGNGLVTAAASAKNTFTVRNLTVMVMTLANHAAWRTFPLLCRYLPEMLLFNSIRGVSLDPFPFNTSPGAAADRTRTLLTEERRLLREYRFNDILDALSSLLKWAQTERRNHMKRVIGFTLPTNEQLNESLQCTEGLPDAYYVSNKKDIDNIFLAEPRLSELQQQTEPSTIISQAEEEEAASATVVNPRVRRKFVGSQPGARSANQSIVLDVPDDQIAEGDAEQLEEVCASETQSKLAALDEIKLLRQSLSMAQKSSEPCVPALRVTMFESHEVCTGTELDDVDADADTDKGDLVMGRPSAASAASAAVSVCTASSRQTDAAEKKLSWMARRGLKRKNIEFLPQERYGTALRTAMLRACPGLSYRDAVHHAFSEEALFSGNPCGEQALQAARAIYGADHAELWGLDAKLVAQTMKSPPPELFQPCSLEDFASEYKTLCAWLPSFKTMPDAHKFWNLEEVHVQVQFDDCSSPTNCRCTKFDHGCFGRSLDEVLKRPTVGAHITFKGKDAVITEVKKSPNMTAIYAHAMCTPLREVRSLRIWHALKSWHRAVHRSLSSSALAEHCGSILRFVEKRCNAAGRPWAVSDVVGSAKVRAAGLFGEGLEDAVLARALNYHFNCFDPSGWHFQKNQKRYPAKLGVLNNHRRKLKAVKKKLPPWHWRLL